MQDFCRGVRTLQELEELVAEKEGASGLAACAAAVQKHLHEAPFTHEEVWHILVTNSMGF